MQCFIEGTVSQKGYVRKDRDPEGSTLRVRLTVKVRTDTGRPRRVQKKIKGRKGSETGKEKQKERKQEKETPGETD